MTIDETKAKRRGARGAGRVTRTKSYNPESRRSFPLTIIVWLMVAYFLLPLMWLVISSTKTNADLFTTFGFWFGNTFALGENLVDVFTAQDGAYIQWTINTVLYAGASAALGAVVSAMAGFAFAKYLFPASRLMFSVVLGAIAIPGTALAIPTYLLFSSLGLTNTPIAIILPSIIAPFGVFLLRVYAADAVPDELIEAARVDGASEFRIFWRIAFPLMGSGIVTVFMFILVATWNNYFLPLIMLTNTDLYPISVGLARQQEISSAGGGTSVLFSTIITGSFVATIPLIIAFLYLQRYWTNGLAGGVKG